jgi:chorismate mutase
MRRRMASDLSSQTQKQEQVQLKKAETQNGKKKTAMQSIVDILLGGSPAPAQTAGTLVSSSAPLTSKEQQEQQQDQYVAQLARDRAEHAEGLKPVSDALTWDRLSNIFKAANLEMAGSATQTASTVSKDIATGGHSTAVINSTQSEIDRLEQQEQDYIDRVTARGGTVDQDYITATFDRPISELKMEISNIPTSDQVDLSAWNDVDAAANKLYTKSGAAQQAAEEGLQPVGKLLVQMGVSGTEMAGDFLVGTATGLGPLAMMGLRSFGDAAYQSAQNGGDVHEQMASGVENAAIQVLTEKLFGGNPAYDAQERGLVTDAIYAAANKLGGAEKLGAVLESVPAKMFGESMEEVIGDYLTPIADWARNGFKGDVQWPDAGNVAQDAAVAAGLSAVGLTANDIVGAAGGVDVPEGAAQTDAHSAAQPSAEAGTVRPAGRTETSSGQTDARPSGATLYDAFMDEVNRNPQAAETSSPGGKSASDTSRQTNSVAAVINSLKTAVKSGDVDADTAASIANTLVNTVNPSAQTAAEGLKTGIDNAGKSGYSGIANMWNPITAGMDYIRGTGTAPVSFAEPSENLDLDYIAGLLHEPIDGNSGTTATKAEAVNPQALENYVNRTLAAQNKYIDKSVNAQSKFADKGAEAMNGYVDDAAERAAAINQAWDDYVNKNVNVQGGYAGKGAKAMSGAVDQYAEGAGDAVTEGAGDVGQYTQKIKWGIQDVEVRPAEKGFFGQRTQQINPRVDAYELKINPNNESYYLKSPAGGYVQYENMVNDVVMDGKLVIQQKSFYHVNDLPDFARNKVLQEAMRQVEAANNVGYTLEWLISDPKAVAQLTDFFKSNNINIVVKYFPE